MKIIDTLWILLDLNYDCNRRCSFCPYVPVRDNGDYGDFTDGMIDVLSDKLGLFIEKYSIEKIKFFISGGEPLLYPQKPLDFSNKIRRLNVPVSISLYTNGDFLTSEIVKSYSDRKVKIALSAGEDSLDEIVRKVNILKTGYEFPRVNVVLSRQNLYRLEKIVQSALDNRYLLRFRGQYNISDDPKLPELYETYVPKALELYGTADYLNIKSLYHTYEDCIPNWNEVKTPYICGRSFLYVNSLGQIKSCGGNPYSDTVGSIFDWNDPIEKLKESVERGDSGRWSAKNLQECQGCEVYELCQGGCPLTRRFAYGRFDRKSPYCSGYKKAFKIFKDIVRRNDDSTG